MPSCGSRRGFRTRRRPSFLIFPQKRDYLVLPYSGRKSHCFRNLMNCKSLANLIPMEGPMIRICWLIKLSLIKLINRSLKQKVNLLWVVPILTGCDDFWENTSNQITIPEMHCSSRMRIVRFLTMRFATMRVSLRDFQHWDFTHEICSLTECITTNDESYSVCVIARIQMHFLLRTHELVGLGGIGLYWPKVICLYTAA